MVRGRVAQEWKHTSTLLALQATLWSKRKSSPSDWDPTYDAPDKSPEVIEAEIADHKAAFEAMAKETLNHGRGRDQGG